jgi:hypothetical protein
VFAGQNGLRLCAYHFEETAESGKKYRYRFVYVEDDGSAVEITSAAVRWNSAVDAVESERLCGRDAWIIREEAGSEGLREVLV